jgi:ABC-2 type transport system ATP-binding protein
VNVRTSSPGRSVGRRPSVAVQALDISRRFGPVHALRDVSLEVRRGHIHALLGPNGAGKTTLLRVLVGLVEPDEGEVSLAGVSGEELASRSGRKLFGLVPSGDRTFYLRLSGLENLLFFGRLQGLSRRDAFRRATEVLEDVGLSDAARRRVGTYSHGMQKRLSIARALLNDPPVLFVDEATHDLDPPGARRVQALVESQARRGAAVIWATQRVDEIRGFASGVTLLHEGRVRFAGTVPELVATAVRRIHVLHLRGGTAGSVLATSRRAVGELGTVTSLEEEEGEHYRLALRDGAVLGEALASLAASGIQVLACREERSEIEMAFLRLTEEEGA